MHKKKFNIQLDYSRDRLLTEFAKTLIRKSYLQETGMTYQEFFAMVANNYSEDEEQAQYMYDMISQLYFMPATPTLANAKYADTNNRISLPISCFLNEPQNNKASIQHLMNETMCVANADGGIGTYWSNMGGPGEELDGQESWGILPFIKMAGDFTRYFGGMCRKTGSGCAYLKVDHPQIEEFINARKPQIGGDQSMSLPRHVHIGVTITNDFIEAVNQGTTWDLIHPTTGKVAKTVDARSLWKHMLITRVETGEPFMIFIDNVNKSKPEIFKKLGLQIHTSNLCTEIVLPTGLDHLGNNRTAICCLGSVNINHFDQIKEDDKFFYNVSKFIDNVRLDFIARAPEFLKDAVYSSIRDSSIGLGVSGLCTYFQNKGLYYGSEESRTINKNIFSYIKQKMDEASYQLAVERGPCEDAKELGIMERFVNKIALKPDALTSYIFNVSSNIEPMPPAFMYNTMYGGYMIRNPVLEKILEKKSISNEEVWNQIISDGSVKNITGLTDEEKRLFQSPYEIDQMVLVEMSVDRQPYICQSQSLNLFLETPIDATKLHQIHMYAATHGGKGFYYLRTKSKFTIENDYRFKNQQKNQHKITVENDKSKNCEISSSGNVCTNCD